jgi:hypothetical protein
VSNSISRMNFFSFPNPMQSTLGKSNCGASAQLFQVARFSSNKKQNPYELLGVPKNATAKEIKIAYFREAKKWHPDMNPGDKKATAKFQAIAAAYEILSDPTRRRIYDTSGYVNDQPGDPFNGSASEAAQHASDIFDTVQEDLDVIKDALSLLTEEIQEELSYAVDCAKNGDWKGLGDVAKDHKFIILGVVVPTVVFLRYPPAVFAVMRVGLALGNVALAGLLRSGNLTAAAKAIWRNIVKISNDQKARSANRIRRNK